MSRARRIARPATVEAAIIAAGGIKQLAELCQVGIPAVCQWTRIPSAHLRTVMRLTGQPLVALRPDLHALAQP